MELIFSNKNTKYIIFNILLLVSLFLFSTFKKYNYKLANKQHNNLDVDDLNFD